MYARHAQRNGVPIRIEVVTPGSAPAVEHLIAHCADELGIMPPLLLIAHDTTFTTAVAAGVARTPVLLA